MWFLTIIFITLIFTYIINQIRKPPNFPPGPRWLPLLGSLLELKKLSKASGGQYLALQKFSEQYNTNVLGLKLGKEYVIVAFSYHVVKEVLTGEEYEGRPKNFFMKLRCMGTRKGITCRDGEKWRIQRNFVVRHLRNLGFGKKLMELMIKDEIKEILQILKMNKSNIQLGKILAPAVINILWTLTTGSKISRENKRLGKLLDLLTLRSKAFDMSGGTLNQYPWLRYIVPERIGYNLITKLNAELKAFFMETITEHQNLWTEGRDDDIIYSFISEMKNATENKTTFTIDQLVMICLDIFIAGSQTTSNTLDFAFLSMILYPDIQVKVQNCLDQCLHQDIDIEYADKQKVPYVEAVLLEVERYWTVAPIIGPRRVLTDTTLQGYLIPKNSTVLISLYSIHHDKQYWGDPENFRPERFLDENGKFFSQDRVIPFGLGKRKCLADVLAKNCIFMIFAEIMRKYTLCLEPGSKVPTGVPLPGIILTPENYEAKLIERY